jgi:hypothetical protein
MVSRLSKAETKKALEELPDVSILGAQATKQLTPKQRAFARKVAMGKTKAQAYREAYKPDATHRTLRSEPYTVAAHPGVAREIEALNLAEQAAAYRTPGKLREFVIQTLLEVALDPETKAAVRVQAVKTLGTVTEVAAFTERKEVRTINTSEAARARVLDEIKALMAASDDVVDVQAKSLLDELTGGPSGNVTSEQPTPDPTPEPTMADSGGEYEHLQVVDSYRADPDQGPGSARKSGVLPPPDPDMVGGV